MYHLQSDDITDTDWSQDKRIFWTSGTPGEPDVLGRRLEDGPYYIFLPCVVWASDDPLNFDNKFLTVLTDEDGSQRAAIAFVHDEDGQDYIAGYGGPGGGIWVAKLKWRY